MAGEFVRTPKKGTVQGRYRAAADLPLVEIALGLISGGSTLASIETGHWFATPFALLFTFGYGYVAFFVASEQLARRKAQSATDSVAAPAMSLADGPTVDAAGDRISSDGEPTRAGLEGELAA
jgi:hypothetical protein